LSEDLFRFNEDALQRAAEAARSSFMRGSAMAGDLAAAFEAMAGVTQTLRQQRDALSTRFPMFADEYDGLRATMRLAVAAALAQGVSAGSFRSFAYRQLRERFEVRRSVYLPHLAQGDAKAWVRDTALYAYRRAHDENEADRMKRFASWMVKRGMEQRVATRHRRALENVVATVICTPETLVTLPVKVLERDLRPGQVESVQLYRKFVRWERRQLKAA